MKSIVAVHSKTSHKLSKTIRQAGKVGSNSSFYSDIKKGQNFLTKKIIIIIKREHAFKGCASTYKVKC